MDTAIGILRGAGDRYVVPGVAKGDEEVFASDEAAVYSAPNIRERLATRTK